MLSVFSKADKHPVDFCFSCRPLSMTTVITFISVTRLTIRERHRFIIPLTSNVRRASSAAGVLPYATAACSVRSRLKGGQTFPGTNPLTIAHR